MTDLITSLLIISLGVLAALVVLIEPIGKMVIIIITYLLDLWRGPVKTKKNRDRKE